MHGSGSVTVTGTDFGLPPGITTGTSTITLDGFLQSSQVTGTVSLNNLSGNTSTGP
jgi:hypothetical protein